MDKKILIWITLMLLLVTFAYSQTPITENPQELSKYTILSLMIESPQFEVLKLNEDVTFYFHVFNKADGNNINSASCIFHLYKSNNLNHIVQRNATLNANGIDYEVFINKTHLNETGYYSRLIQCSIVNQNITFGDANELSFIVTPSGYQATTSEMYFYIFSLTVILILFIASLIGISTIDDRDTYDITGTKLLRMNSGIIIKMFLIMFSIFLFWIITFILWQISFNSLMLTFITNILYNIYLWYTILMIPIILMLLAFIFVRFVTQLKFKKDMKRGIV